MRALLCNTVHEAVNELLEMNVSFVGNCKKLGPRKVCYDDAGRMYESDAMRGA